MFSKNFFQDICEMDNFTALSARKWTKCTHQLRATQLRKAEGRKN